MNTPLRITLEIAVDSVADAASAASVGADRLELCSDLAGHGYTPEVALVEAAAAELPGVRTVAMVRPREAGPDAAGFVYGRDKWWLAMRDAEQLLAAGAGGLVFGCLSADGSLNPAQVHDMVTVAAGRETVFHRAIELTPDPLLTAEALADLGVTRILTSGMSLIATAADLFLPAGRAPNAAGSAWQSGGDRWPRRLDRLAEMAGAIGDRIEILPGGGVRAENAAGIVARTGCRQIHSSGRSGGRFDAAAVARLRASIDAAR